MSFSREGYEEITVLEQMEVANAISGFKTTSNKWLYAYYKFTSYLLHNKKVTLLFFIILQRLMKDFM